MIDGPTTLQMEQVQLDAIRQHGEETYPYECCGVLLGHSEAGVNAVADAARAENVRLDSPHNRYQIAPQELVRIQREARKRGLDIVGFYHSHPDHPAQWSKTDLAEAHWLGCSYVIASVVAAAGASRCRAAETNAFLLAGHGEDDKRFENQAIAVVAPVGVQ
ncbi:MAG: M67 family metallopeptidase [Acidobacteriaceae bacterium]